MNRLLERALKNVRAYHPLRNWILRKREQRRLAEWRENGRPLPPPPAAKQLNLLAYSQKYGLRVLVETGTYRGDTVHALRNDFDRIYSIELSPALHAEAQDRFRGSRNIELIQGDSGEKLADLMPRLDRPTLFWLDGHYSAGVTAKGDKATPIFEELGHVFADTSNRHVVVIDDARLFGTDPGYPSMEELCRFIRSKNPAVDIAVQDDSIRITPRSQTA
ncbi:MAG: hypothetical protein EOL90_09735 [Spartobacteria bacterium]|nr:hypothetical protein [Spartobacteria bacterium]